MGYRLFADALSPQDPFRVALLEETDRAQALRNELDAMARALTEDELRLLCDHVALRAKETQAATCAQAELGYLLESSLVPRQWVLADHLTARLAEPQRDPGHA